ncbi:hypothetical protein Acr_14g0006810 [Actinidia rufa]|uniref:Retrotransposon Copia-like N-terminal domain-containing protein n=1 Tax=Actinidia rufa TaxID=165716 RepID=A0A7J0FQQ1_9ERIC|nr:hypothetical protein Acr_14g0006810 [Actinidia rufa]
MSGSNVENVVVSPPPPRPDFFLSQHTPDARFTCELLNGKNFAAWSRSVRLFLGGKGKSGWLLGTITKPNATYPKFVQWEIDNCTILGWLFNSMEPRIYHVFILSTPLPCRPSLRSLLYLTVMSAAIAFYSYLLHLSQSLPSITDQMALTASGSRFSGGRSSSGRAPCSFCGGVTHGRDRSFKLHPELRETFKRNKEKSKLQTQFQNQMEQLQLQFQTQLGSLMQQSPRPNPSPSTATLTSGIPAALHAHLIHLILVRERLLKDPSIFSRPVPLFESPQVASPTLPPVLTSNPRHMYSRCPPA